MGTVPRSHQRNTKYSFPSLVVGTYTHTQTHSLSFPFPSVLKHTRTRKLTKVGFQGPASGRQLGSNPGLPDFRVQSQLVDELKLDAFTPVVRLPSRYCKKRGDGACCVPGTALSVYGWRVLGSSQKLWGWWATVGFTLPAKKLRHRG